MNPKVFYFVAASGEEIGECIRHATLEGAYRVLEEIRRESREEGGDGWMKGRVFRVEITELPSKYITDELTFKRAGSPQVDVI